MEERRGDFSPTSSLKHRLKNSIKSCFKNNNNNNPHQHYQLHNDNDNDSPPQQQQQQQQHRTLVRSSSGMMRHFINRIGTPRASHHHHHHHHHRKSKSTDFRYDLQSYALNFDDDDNAAFRDDFPFRDFTSRLPPSPSPSPPSPQPHHPTTSSPTRPWEITACS